MEMPLSRSASQLFTLYWEKIGFTENGTSLTVVAVSSYLRVALGMRRGIVHLQASTVCWRAGVEVKIILASPDIS
jgi:hypothetical protein